MDLYHTGFDLKPGVSDVEFAASLDRYLGKLRADGRIAGHRLCSIARSPPYPSARIRSSHCTRQ